MVAQLTIFPTDHGTSVGEFVARAVAVIRSSGLPYQLTAMATLVEGEPEQIFDLLKACHAALAVDCDRIYMTVALDDRRGATNRLQGKVDSVLRHLG